MADGAVVLGQDECSCAEHHDGFGLASRPFMLRPLPHRGDVVAAGAVALAALVALLQVRFDDSVGDGRPLRLLGRRRWPSSARWRCARPGRATRRAPTRARCWP